MTKFRDEDLDVLRMPATSAHRTECEEVQCDVAAWAEETFGEFDGEAVLKHLQEEIHELSASLRLNDKAHVILEECADVVLLVMQIASSCDGSIEAAVAHKFDLNTGDEWEYRPELGYSKRVKR